MELILGLWLLAVAEEVVFVVVLLLQCCFCFSVNTGVSRSLGIDVQNALLQPVTIVKENQIQDSCLFFSFISLWINELLFDLGEMEKKKWIEHEDEEE